MTDKEEDGRDKELFSPGYGYHAAFSLDSGGTTAWGLMGK